MSCEMVKTQEPLRTPLQTSRPEVTTGEPQHLVVVVPVCAKGVTVTGTQIDAD